MKTLKIQDNKVQCTIWGSDIEVLQDTLKPFQTYSISNARVEKLDEAYRFHNHDLQWTLSCRTPIEQLSVPGLNVRILRFNFVPLKDLSEHVNNDRGFGMSTMSNLNVDITRQKIDITCA